MAHIKRIYAKDYQTLKVIDLELPETGVVHITGPNGAGKTAVLNVAFIAFGSAKGAPAIAIRKGEEKAVVTVETEKIKVTRTFWYNKNSGEQMTRLVVENQEGAVFRRGQELLDEFWSPIAMDPLRFARADQREQYEDLRRLVQLPVDIDALDAANREDYEARTAVNREARRLRDQAEGVAVQPDLPEAAIDDSKLIDELQRAGELNAKIERMVAARERKVERIASLRSQAHGEDGLVEVALAQVYKHTADSIADIDAEIRELEIKLQVLRDNRATVLDEEPQRLASARREHEEKAARLRAAAEEEEKSLAEDLPAKADVEALRARIADAQRINAAIRLRDDRARLEAAGAEKEAEAKRLTDAMADRDRQKAEALAGAQMPILGLGWQEGVVLYRDLPLSQASSAEQLRVSVAIAMAMNPNLKFIRLQDGPLLDDDSLAMLTHMVEEAGFLCLIESVDSAGKVGYILEEGEVVEVVTPEVAEQTKRPPRERRRKVAEPGPQEGLL